MDRRNFLKSMMGGVVAAAAVQSFPFRVFSFPKEIKIAHFGAAYADYTSFSEFRLAKEIDREVALIAEELGTRAAQTLDELWYQRLAFSAEV